MFEYLAHAFGGLGQEAGVARVWHVGRQVEQGLLPVVEVRGDGELAGVVQAKAFADVVEAALHGEGGGGEDDGAKVGEEIGLEDFGDVNGCGLQEGLVGGGRRAGACQIFQAASGAALDPEDGVDVLGFHEEPGAGAEVDGAAAEAGGFFHVLEAFKLVLQAVERDGEAGVVLAVLFEEAGAVVEDMAAELKALLRQRGEEHAGALAQDVCCCFDAGRTDFFGAEEEFGVAGEFVGTLLRDGDAEVVAGHPFQLVGLVKDDGGGLWQHACIRCACGLQLDVEVCEEKVVVDDDDVGLQRPPSHRRDPAGLEVGALLAKAGFRAGVEFAEEGGGLGEAGDLRAVAGGGVALPGADDVELADLFGLAEQWRGLQRIELLLADVVAAALHGADLEWSQERLKERDVFEEELFLQVLGAGADDDALALIAGHAKRGQQVGEGFAGAGACLHDEVTLFFKRALDGFRHLKLAGAVLIGERGLGQHAAG